MTLKRERTKNEKIASSSSSSAIDHDEESSLQGIAHIKSAEDRKTAAALSSIDVTSNDDCDGILGNSNSSPDNLDQEAVKKAMERLNKNSSLVGNASGPKEKNVQSSNGILSASKSIKVDPTDVTLLVEELELSKAKATSLLKSFEGDVQKALRSQIYAN